MKRGAEGWAAVEPDGTWTEVRLAPRPDLDPVGAGDAFNAGYVAARLRGRSVAEALEQGSLCGAGVAAAVGDTAGFPTAQEIEGGVPVSGDSRRSRS